MVGAGALAPHLIHAHSAVRPIKRVTIWNRTRGNAVKLAFALSLRGMSPRSRTISKPVSEADMVSCATLSATPLIRGKWLKKGAHLDLVGAYAPKMREADDDAIRRSRVYVDTRIGAPKEAGDIVQPLNKGILKKTGIRGDLYDSAAARPRAGQSRARSRCSSGRRVGGGLGGRDAGVAFADVSPRV